MLKLYVIIYPLRSRWICWGACGDGDVGWGADCYGDGIDGNRYRVGVGVGGCVGGVGCVGGSWYW